MSDVRHLWFVILCRILGHRWESRTPETYSNDRTPVCSRCRLMWAPLLFGIVMFCHEREKS